MKMERFAVRSHLRLSYDCQESICNRLSFFVPVFSRSRTESTAMLNAFETKATIFNNLDLRALRAIYNLALRQVEAAGGPTDRDATEDLAKLAFGAVSDRIRLGLHFHGEPAMVAIASQVSSAFLQASTFALCA